MAKTKISEFDVDPNNNTDINSINIAEGCAPAGINNAIRQLMSDLKEWQSGAMDKYIVPAGTAAAPSVTFYGDTDSGFYSGGANIVGVSVGGVSVGTFSSSGFTGNVVGNVTGNASTATSATTATNVTGTVAIANGGTGLTSLTANNLLVGNGTSSLQFIAPSTSGNVLTSNGTVWQSTALPTATTTGSGLIELATSLEVQTGTDAIRAITPSTFRDGALVLTTVPPPLTGSTYADVTGIPSWVKRITIVFVDGVSTNGTSPIIVQLGTSSGFQTTGYESAASFTSSSGGYLTSTSGFLIDATNTAIASYGRYGTMTIVTAGSASTDTFWAYSANIYAKGSQVCTASAGGKTIGSSGVVDRIRITTTNGTDTFDAGAFGIIYE